MSRNIKEAPRNGSSILLCINGEFHEARYNMPTFTENLHGWFVFKTHKVYTDSQVDGWLPMPKGESNGV
jgi:hypothetical protein